MATPEVSQAEVSQAQVSQAHAGKQGTQRPQAADLFRHAHPWRFASPDDGRKYRVVRERLRRLARCLARFDRSGNCREIFPAIAKITARLNAAELNYPEGRRFKWSRKTVFRYLDRLERGGIATASGLSHYHGTRRRELHPERLLSVPLESDTPIGRESDTPTRPESDTGSKSLKTWKIHKQPLLNKSSGRKHDDDLPGNFSESKIQINPAGKIPVDGTAEAARLARLKAEAMAEVQIRTSESDDMVDAVLDLVLRRAADAGTIIRSRRYLVESFENHMAEAAAAPTARCQAELIVGRGPEVDRTQSGDAEATAAPPPNPDVHDTADVDRDAWTANLGRLEESGIATVDQRVRCPDCDCSVLRWALEDGLHRKVCPGRATC